LPNYSNSNKGPTSCSRNAVISCCFSTKYRIPNIYYFLQINRLGSRTTSNNKTLITPTISSHSSDSHSNNESVTLPLPLSPTTKIGVKQTNKQTNKQTIILQCTAMQYWGKNCNTTLCFFVAAFCGETVLRSQLISPPTNIFGYFRNCWGKRVRCVL